MDGVRIIRQVVTGKHGNDCYIKDVVIMFEVHDTYVVEAIRRYSGWCDNGLDFRYRKEFQDAMEANDYFDALLDDA